MKTLLVIWREKQEGNLKKVYILWKGVGKELTRFCLFVF